MTTPETNEEDAPTPFAALYQEWLQIRGRKAQEGSEKTYYELMPREEELVSRIIGARAIARWELLQKFEVLEAYHDTSNWTDNRDLRLAASIKADLRGFRLTGR